MCAVAATAADLRDDVQQYRCDEKGQHKGKHIIAFTVMKVEEARMIKDNKQQLRQEGYPVREWCTDEDLAIRRVIRGNAEFQKAAEEVKKHPNTRGYTMRFEMDRGFTVVARVRTYWTIESIKQQAAQAAAAAAAAAGGQGGAPMQVDGNGSG